MIDKLKVKDANSTLMFGFDWSNWLNKNGEIITEFTLSTPPDGLIITNEGINGGLITFLASGGVFGKVYPVVCQIKTSAGQIDERTMLIRIEDF